MYIDFHAHILPSIDDGSQNTVQSLSMLAKSREQRIKKIVCTPHYDPLSMSAEEFLMKRKNSKEIFEKALQDAASPNNYPALSYGAECKYIKKISRFPGIEKLCIEGTSWLLLELPYSDWEEDIFEEIYLLAAKRGVFSIIAHPDRFIKQIKKQDALRKFWELDCVLQLNAGAFTRFSSRKQSLNMLDGISPCVLGSDMHSEDPEEHLIPEAISAISHKLDRGITQKIALASEALLKNEPPRIMKRLWL